MIAPFPRTLIGAVLSLGIVSAAHSQGCALAPEIFNGDTPFDTAGATETLDLSGICDPGPFGDDSIYHTIWFKWIAPSSDTYQVSTCNQANFDTRLAVLEAGCSPADTIACLDDTAGCANFTTVLTFAAIQDVTYYIAVGGYSATTPSGSGTLSLGLGGGGGGGVCGGSNPQSCCSAGSAPGCSDPDCCSLVCSADPFCCNVQWDGICAEESLSFCADLCLVECVGPTPTVSEAEPCGEDLNGGCNSRPQAFEDISIGDVIEGSFWSSGGSRDTDWYRFSVSEGTEVTASLYASVPARTYLITFTCPPTILAANPTTGGCPSGWTKCLPPGEYGIFVATTGFDGFPCFSGLVNEYTLDVQGIPCDASAPANDECSKAELVGDGDTFFDTSFATTSPLPLDPVCDEGFGTNFVNDVWYRWQASCTGLATVSTCNQADFDTRLAAYTDCDGALIACNDDGTGCDLTSLMNFACVQGSFYYIRVGGYAGGGTGVVSISCSLPLSNDECDTATPIADGSTPFSTIGATTSLPPLDAVCDEGFGLAFVNDVWFRYTASCTGTVTVSACNQANFDTRLAAYSSCGGTLIACNDDSAGCGLTSLMQFSATTNQIVYLRVGGFSGSGAGTLTISCSTGGGGCSSNDTCDCATPIALGNTSFSSVGAASDPPTVSPAFCGSFGTGFYRDIWYVLSPEQDGHLIVSTCSQASYDTRLELWDGCPSAGGTLVACNDDGVGCTTFTSLMEADITCLRAYYIRVGSYAAGTTGSGTLSLSLSGGNACGPACTPGADRNGDGCVNGADLALVTGNWTVGGLNPYNPLGDANCDGQVNGADLASVIGNWQPVCP